MSDSVAGQIEYVMSSWYAARQRFRDVPGFQVIAYLRNMWSGVFQKCTEEISKQGVSKNVAAYERLLQLLKVVSEIVTKKIETKFS